MFEVKLQRSRLKLPEHLRDSHGTFQTKNVQTYYPLFESLFKVEHIPAETLKTMALSMDTLETVIDETAILKDGTKVPYFMKHICLLNPFEYICGEYTTNQLDSFGRSYSTFKKLNDKQNSAYVDIFLSGILSTVCHTFPKYYGAAIGTSERYTFDITDDFMTLTDHESFRKNYKKCFTLSAEFEFEDSPAEQSSENQSGSVKEHLVWDVESCHSCEEEQESITEEQPDESEEQEDQPEEQDDEPIFATLKDVPAAYVFMEKLEGTLFELGIQQRVYDPVEWKSWVFQIAWGLYVAQAKANFFHNDLHSNNVMYKSTEQEFLYFKFEDRFYKLPTFGRIMKIIDFGRSIATLQISGLKHPKTFMCDLFREDQEAAGQFNWGPQRNPDYPEYEPNPSFDMVYLSISLLDILPTQDKNDELRMALLDWVKDDSGKPIHEKENGRERYHGFDIYKAITRKCKNAKPAMILSHSMFQEFLVPKDTIPLGTQIFALD